MSGDSINKVKTLLRLDEDRPRLFSFFALEVFKWGSIATVVLLLYSCSQPILSPMYLRLRYIFSGDEKDRSIIEESLERTKQIDESEDLEE